MRRVPVPGRGRAEEALETAVGHKIRVPKEKRRNGIGVKYEGDKLFGQVEDSVDFFKYGSTVAHSDFGKISGSRGEYRRAMVGGTELGMSRRADAYGRSRRSRPLYVARR